MMIAGVISKVAEIFINEGIGESGGILLLSGIQYLKESKGQVFFYYQMIL
jgi:hypothetical protein